MISVLFICHANICRSPMAEFIFKDLVRKAGVEDKFEVASAAASKEGIGYDMYPPVKKKLREKGISFEPRQARQITEADIEHYDRIVLMDGKNLNRIKIVMKETQLYKLSLLMDYTPHPGDVADPWFTGDFDTAYDDIELGCRCLLNNIMFGDQSDES